MSSVYCLSAINAMYEQTTIISFCAQVGPHDFKVFEGLDLALRLMLEVG